jgi:FkbM family methyltransferase
MVLSTQRLFVQLLREMSITTICDIGSMNGDDALSFRAALPDANIFAFEANPENLRRMQISIRLREENIRVVPLAITNYDGEAHFFVVAADYSTVNGARGQSSLYRRSGESGTSAAIVVKTARLDTFLGAERLSDARLALWIDVEGKAYEALEGAAGVIRHVQIIHVEVEAEPCIASDQRLHSETKALLRGSGFVEVGTDGPLAWDQFNALFVRSDLSTRLTLRVAKHVATAHVRSMLAGTVRRSRTLARDAARRLLNALDDR